MRRLLTTTGFAALLAAVLTGCGAAGSGAASSPPTTEHSVPATGTGTDMAISYPVHAGTGSRSHASQSCPAGASCTYTAVGSTPKGAEVWEPVAEYHLTCSPAAGTYPDPAAACRALLDLQRRMAARHPICMCPMIVTGLPQPHVQGVVDGKPLTLKGACSFCGLGKQGAADASVLMPGGAVS